MAIREVQKLGTKAKDQDKFELLIGSIARNLKLKIPKTITQEKENKKLQVSK